MKAKITLIALLQHVCHSSFHIPTKSGMPLKHLAKVALFVLLPLPVYAGTYTAATCSYSAVNAVINGPTHTLAAGDTIIIPAGSCTWSSQLTVTVPTSSSSSTVTTIQGATVCTGSGDPASTNLSCTDNTTITGAVSQNPSLIIVPPATGEVRLTGLTFTSSTVTYHGIVEFSGTSTNPGIRVDHNDFAGNSAGTSDLVINGWIYGVIDHNRFHALISDENMTQIQNGGYWNNSNDGFGHASWADSSYWGSNKFIFIEANTFDSVSSAGYQIIDDCSLGGRFVARFNTLGYHQVPYTHGTDSSDAYRGCRAFEIYGNTATWDSGNAGDSDYTFMNIESGTGLLWGNNISGQNSILNEDSSRSCYPNCGYTFSFPPNGWGFCGNHFSGQSSDSPWDGNQNTTTGYPCLDQPGRGKGDLVTGDFPTACDQTLGCTTHNGQWPNQALEPVYMWANVITQPSTWAGYWTASYSNSLMQNNRDYYFSCGALNSSCASFSGAAGVGQGTLASKPSNCTTGVGYWATDQGSWNQSGNNFGNGVFYVCTTTNTWTSFYTPYTYPHPLTQSQSSGTSPAPPTNFDAVVN